MLAKSCLPTLEDALGRGMMETTENSGRFHGVGNHRLRVETGRVINIRKRDLTEQMMELKGLQETTAP